MHRAAPFSPVLARPLRRLPLARVAGLLLLTLALLAAVGTATSQADVALQQWQPTSADLVRTLRTCPLAVSAPTPPVCWSVSEDTSAWMAQPTGSPYPWGQCTYYAGLMRPDIWDDRAPPSVDPLNDWDAWTWVEHAQAEGLSVNGTPEAGDVMVYSRQAVGNDTGHVAIVDSVAGADPSTGDLVVTVSEMNVDGLDDASLGQGDTMTLLLPTSQLVPGMIQFIHAPGPGYTPPSWSPGSGGAVSATVASQSPAWSDPSLGVGLFGNNVETVSESPAPVQATVTALRSGLPVTHLSFAANRGVSLDLPSGTYTVCVAQAATGRWSAAGGCVTGSWQSAPVRPSLRLGRIRRVGARLVVAVELGPHVPLAAGAVFAARIRVTVRPPAGRGHRATAAAASYRVDSRLHAGSQVVDLRLGPGGLRGCVVGVSVTTLTGNGTAGASAQASTRIA
jgi:surface antigen